MADQKISELTQGTPLETDVIPYVDGATGTTKKALKSELKGAAGAAATATAGTTTTGTPGSSASVTNVGSTSAAVFNFTIPAGSVIHSTVGIPSNSVGVNGDWAFDTSVNSYVYFKSGGAWSLVNSNRGATGADGAAGATGATGAAGSNGTNGTNGSDGLDINWLGVYSGATAYVINDAVSYLGSSYICKLNTTNNLPTNGTYWDILAQKGDAGAGSGDMVLADVQTITGVKTFNTGTFKLNENVAVTATATELNYVDGVTSPIQTQINGKKTYHGVVGRPVGAQNPLPSNMTSSLFTLGATANPISYYYQGTKVDVVTNKTVNLGAAGYYFIYFDGSTGNLAASTIPPGFTYESNVIIATVNWNGSNYGLVNDERHSYTRDINWHSWAHSTIGVRYGSGITLTHNSGTGAAATFSVTAGNVYDEDIDFTVNASSAWPTVNALRTFFQDTVTTHQFDNTPSTVPFRLGTGGRPEVVDSSTFVKSTLPSAVNRYINAFIYVTDDLHTPLYSFVEVAPTAVITDGGYTSVANARAVPFPSLTGKGVGQELKAIYRLIIRADGALQAIDTTQDDYRTVTSLPQAAGVGGSTASSVSFSPAGGISAATVQTAIEELDLEKAPKASPTFTGTVTLPTGLTGVIRADSGVVSVDTDVTDLVSAASTTAAGKVEIATGAEVDTGTDDVRAVSPKAVADSAITTASKSQTLTNKILGAGTIIGENSIQLDAALSADGKWSGITETGTAGAALAFGDLCYFQASDSRWELADANLSAGYDKKLGMCVLAAAGDASATEMLLIGKIRADANFPTLTIGSPVYMAETAGDIVVAQPTTADVCIRVIGYANTADELYFNPSQDYIIHT